MKFPAVFFPCVSPDGSCISLVKERITAKSRGRQIAVTLFSWLMQRCNVNHPSMTVDKCSNFITLLVLLVLYGVSENQGVVFVKETPPRLRTETCPASKGP